MRTPRAIGHVGIVFAEVRHGLQDLADLAIVHLGEQLTIGPEGPIAA